MTLPTGARGQFMALAILAIVLLLAYRFVAQPTISAYHERQDAIADTQRAIRRYRHLLAQAPAIEQFNRRYARQNPLAPLLLPGSSPALSGAALQQRLQDLAAQHEVRVLSLRIGQAQQDDRFERVAVEVRIQSDTTGVRNLLYEIEQHEPYLFVDSLEVRSRPQRRGTASRSTAGLLDIRLVVFGLRAPTIAALSEAGR